MATEWRSEGFVSQLQDLVLKHEEVHDFLQDLAGLSAEGLALDAVIGCSVTLRHRDATFTVAFSTPEVIVMDEVQYEVREGPGLEAINTGSTVIVDDVRSEDRWVEYGQKVRNFGISAVMAVPLGVAPDGGAVLNFYARAPHVFTRTQLRMAEAFAAQAARALEMSLRITSGSRRVGDLRGALEARTVLDLAVGIIMAENRCSQEQALSILKRSAETQDVPVRLIAERVVSTIDGDTPETHFTT